MVRRSARSSPLSPDLLALLAGCRAAPADDTPRLVLADWLDENADTAGLSGPDDARNRAALIRIQVELGRPTWDTGRISQLRAAEAQLLSANAAQWLGDLPPRLEELRRRPQFGFGREAPRATQPVFKFDPLEPYNPWRFYRGLLTVNLAIKELTDRALGKWFASPLAAWVEEAGVDVSGFNELMSLRVSQSLRPYLGVRYELGKAPQPTLRLVNPPAEQLNSSRLRRLLDCANFAHVRSLSVFTPAVEAGFLPLLAGADLGGVRWLTVRAPLTDTNAAFLAAAPFVNLSALDVSGCDIEPDGMRLLVGSPHLHGLVSLRAFRNRFGCDGLVALAASPLAERLNVLAIQNTGIGDRGVQALAESPLLERLVGPELNLSMNPIGDAGARALAASPQLEPFTELVLRECQVGDTGAAALAASPHVVNLKYLDLWKNRVGNAGAAALAASPHLSGVRELSIRDNLITATGARALHKRFGDLVKV